MLKMIFFVVVGLSLIGWISSLGTQIYKYGMASISPKINLKTVTREMIEPVLIPGTTARQELFGLFGPPKSERPKVVFTGSIEGNKMAEKLANHRTIEWREWVGHYFIISISSKTQLLTVYLNDNDTVADFELKTEH